MIEKVLDYDPPDLVVLNGDLITGENAYLHNGTAVVDQMMRPMVDRGLPWASTYGNHDHQYNVSGDTILEHEKRWPNSLTKKMVLGADAGTSNYYLPVLPHNCTKQSDCAPELLLWFFDSRGGFEYQVRHDDGSLIGKPNWVDNSVVEWFQATNARLIEKHGRMIPSLAFVHIPTNASQALQTIEKVDPNTEPGIDDDYPNAVQSQGWCPGGYDDGSCDYGALDVPFMKAITETKGLMALFSGHDHGDTWCYKWDKLVPGMTVEGTGVNLCFGQHTGYGGYGNWIRGARQVLVSLDKLPQLEVDTWVRLESGKTAGEVSLNATYGQDRYPRTPNEKTSCPTCNYTIVTPMPGTKQRAYAAHVNGRAKNDIL